MLDPRLLYTLDEEVVASLADAHPVLIHQLDGFVDAGGAGRQLTSHLLEHLDHEVVATFDHDQLHDYRSRRPAMVFDTNTWKSYADLHLRLYRVVDEQGEVFLLLSGPEPDVQWERFAAAVMGLIERLGVRLTISAHGIPMAVPHTRPITLTAHATDADLVVGYRSWIDRVEVPASFTGLLEFRLGQADRRAMGFAVHVPHYLAQATFPEAALSLTRSLNAATGLAVPLEPLEEGLGEQPRRHRRRDADLARGAGAGVDAGAAVRRVAGRAPGRAERRGDRGRVREVPRRPGEGRVETLRVRNGTGGASADALLFRRTKPSFVGRFVGRLRRRASLRSAHA